MTQPVLFVAQNGITTTFAAPTGTTSHSLEYTYTLSDGSFGSYAVQNPTSPYLLSFADLDNYANSYPMVVYAKLVGDDGTTQAYSDASAPLRFDASSTVASFTYTMSGYNALSAPLDGITNVTSLTVSSFDPQNVTGTTTIDLSGSTGITTLEVVSCQADVLDLTGMTALTSLNLNGSNIGSIVGLSSCTALTSLFGSVTSSSVDVTGAASLTSLNLSNTNTLQTVSGLTSCVNLETLDLSGTIVSSVNLTGLTSLTGVSLPPSVATLTGISTLSSLVSFVMFDNGNTLNIDLSDITTLTLLRLSGCTGVASLDVSGCTALATLRLDGCSGLTSLNIVGLPLTFLDLIGCSGLTSVTVDSATPSAALQAIANGISGNTLTINQSGSTVMVVWFDANNLTKPASWTLV